MQLFFAFIVALSTTAALIPVLARWAPALGLTDKPNPRKVHAVPVPRVGGLAMGVGLLLPALVILPLSGPLRGVLAGILVLLVFGLWDDRAELGYRTKLLGQIIAVALCMKLGGVRISPVVVDGINILPGIAADVVTFVFLVGVINAVNLTDGLDGLAGGLVLLCLCAVGLFAMLTGHAGVIALCLIEAGAILGFLRFNTHPARIFMGDSGSQVLGFSVGALALLATQHSDGELAASLPLLLLGLPILDTATVMVTRIRQGRSPFAADKNHLHHRLLALGFFHHEAVAIVYVLQVSLVLLAWFMRYESDTEVAGVFLMFAAGTLGALQWARATGWRFRSIDNGGGYSRPRLLPTMARLPAIALGLMLAGLVSYAAIILVTSPRVSMDLGVLSGVLLAALLLASWRILRPLHWFERTAAYVGVVSLVYLDQTASGAYVVEARLSWMLIAITGAAALARFIFSPARKFDVTTLDLIVVFIALVLPNLPASGALPVQLSSGIAKAVILLYAVEMLLTFNIRVMAPRIVVAVTLAAIAGRAFL